MIVHVVLWHGALIGLYTSAPDAANASKVLDRSIVVQCHLNATSVAGGVYVANQMYVYLRLRLGSLPGRAGSSGARGGGGGLSPGGGRLIFSEHQGPPLTRIHPCR